MRLNKVIIGIIIIGVVGLIYISGVNDGKAHIKIVHDTTAIVDTTVRIDTFYKPAVHDTIIINKTKYDTRYSFYDMHRGGKAEVWYIPQRDEFKWRVKEPKPLIITKTKYEQVNIPVISWKATAIAGVIGLAGGFLACIFYK